MEAASLSPAAKAIVRGYIRNDSVTLAGLRELAKVTPTPELTEAVAYISGAAARTAEVASALERQAAQGEQQ